MTTENKDENEVVAPTEEEETAALMAAIDDGITEVSPHLQEENDDTNTDDAGDGTDGGNAAEGEIQANADAGTVDKPDGDKEDETGGKSKDEDGAADATKTEGDGSGDGTKADASKPGDESDESNEAAAEVDPINDPIPESTNEKTATRIKSLIDIAKEQSGLAVQRDELLTAITDTGADPEQYTNTLGFLSLYNSTDPATRKQALEVIRGLERELSIELGEGNVDILAEHKDLQDEVEAGTLDQARAVELATGRARTALAESKKTAADKKTADDKADADGRAAGRAQLTAFEQTAMADPRFAELRPALLDLLRDVLRDTHTSQWGAKAASIYAKLKKNTPIPVKPAAAPANQPLRAKQGAGNATPNPDEEPKSAEDAMDAALASM